MPNSQQVGSCLAKLFKLGVLLLIFAAVWLFFLKEYVGRMRDKEPAKTLKKAIDSREDDGPADVAKLLKKPEDVLMDVGILAEGTTWVEQIVMWQIVDGVIYYRIILKPYDEEAHKLMASPLESIFISFISKTGELLAPKSAARKIEMRNLKVAMEDGKPAAWFTEGALPIDKADQGRVEKSVVGWFFTARLHARLREAPREQP